MPAVPASLSERPVATSVCATPQPHATHREMVYARDGHKGIGLPTRLRGTPGSPGASPRPFNSGAVCVLNSLGFTALEIDQLFADGIVPMPRLDAGHAAQA
ncbi:hypothetical protein VAPA_2c08320 [Variovorax paradoxus B4]|uniref:Uncharacterized protein n=1 Tax=Variovorax paradoxus B4 TaxID=1246301 RepID=T1XLB3_VARPD|nr:hypothetical protein VAPA_2c08320 [Variovorax paradoxus B4]